MRGHDSQPGVGDQGAGRTRHREARTARVLLASALTLAIAACARSDIAGSPAGPADATAAATTPAPDQRVAPPLASATPLSLQPPSVLNVGANGAAWMAAHAALFAP